MTPKEYARRTPPDGTWGRGHCSDWDNQNAADFLCNSIGTADPFVQWVAVRPDSLLEGDVSEYVLHEGLVSSLTRPDSTNMAYVAHFICGLVVNPNAWNEWKGRLPVIINAARSDR